MGNPSRSGISYQRDDEGRARLIGESAVFQRVLARLRVIASSDATILIEGETGTGKELAARAIHDQSERRNDSFIAVNCGAIPDTLVEDELFGHERGAFTDAHQPHGGLVRAAERGTLCFDEVGSLSSRAQAVVLRLLQDKTFRSLGCTREERANVRFIALSNTPLLDLVRRGTFRADLYYRLSVLSVTIPPLRERRDDILPLANHFLGKHRRVGSPIRALTSAAQAALEAYEWPGNVRELENTIIRASCTSTADLLTDADLDLVMPLGEPIPDSRVPSFVEPLRELKRRLVDAFERDYLAALMRQCRGNVTRAARIAGKERRDFGKLLKRHRIERTSYDG